MKNVNIKLSSRGFTLVEILVTISIVAILASIGLISYTGYRSSVIETQLRSDLGGVAAAMEDYKNFNDAYPLSVPSNFVASIDTDLAVFYADGASYCIDATNDKDLTIQYYIDDSTSSIGAQAGTCEFRSIMNSATCEDTDKYGEYPNCYDYDALPIATSISGYWTTAPAGYLLEDGSLVSRNVYSDLFTAIGVTYGAGDGENTFKLPDSRGKVTVSRKISDPNFGTVGQTPGSKTQTVSIAQMPSHTHSGSFASTTHGHGLSGWTSALNYPAGRDSYEDNNEQDVANIQHIHPFSGWTGVPSFSANVSSQGSNAAHNNIQPTIVKSFAIKYAPSTGNYSRLPASTSISGYFTTEPTGYLFEDGRAVSRLTYADLYAALGGAASPFGQGNGVDTFNLPDSRGYTAVNIDSTDSRFNAIGDKYGEPYQTLSINQIPSHNHSSTFAASNHQHSYSGTTSALNYPDGRDSYNDPNEEEDANTSHTHTFSGWTGVTDHSAQTVKYEGGGQGHSEIQPSIVKTSVIKYTAAAGEIDTLPKGTSISGYFMAEPDGYLFEDGRAVSRSTYADLYTALGGATSPFGQGDGSTTFNLPDSSGRAVANISSSDGEFDVIGKESGTKDETLSIAQMPSHNHNSSFAGNGHTHYFSFWSGTLNWPDGKNMVDEKNDQEGANTNHVHIVSGTTGAANTNTAVGSNGGGLSHSNYQPTIVQRFAIKF